MDSLQTQDCAWTEKLTMSFLQAYYTSCERGLRGSKGFQINAATEGLDPSLLQQVERLGLYVPPVEAPSRPTAEEIERFPVSLLYQRLGDDQLFWTFRKLLHAFPCFSRFDTGH